MAASINLGELGGLQHDLETALESLHAALRFAEGLDEGLDADDLDSLARLIPNDLGALKEYAEMLAQEQRDAEERAEEEEDTEYPDDYDDFPMSLEYDDDTDDPYGRY